MSMNDPDRDYQECQDAAIRAGALQPQGTKEAIAASWLSYQGQSFAATPLAQSRLRAWIEACLKQKGYGG
jgi:hypothetical protein